MRFDQAMLDHGMVPSKSEANRLIRQGAAWWRHGDELWQKILPGDELLEPYPDTHIKVGNGLWRCVKTGEHRFEKYPGIITVPGIADENGDYIMKIPLAMVKL